MSGVIRNFMLASIGGVVAYYVSNFVLTTLITGTTDADTFVTSILPIIIAIGAVWIILGVAFKGA